MSAEKKGLGIRYSIFIYFTVTALVAILSIGLSMYDRFSDQLTEASQNEDQILMNQVNRSVDTYLRNIMRLSDALYYGVVKNTDISEEGIFDRMKLLYDSNDGTVENIALFSGDGELLSVAPAARLRSTVRTWEESWFKEPLEKMENLHFSMPHVQYIFDDAKSQYKWVISVSRAVEVTKGVSVSQGVLLIDIRYSSLEQLLENVTLGNGGYVYLISNDGQIIYHPKAQLIDSGRVQEDHQKAAGYRDGTYEEVFQGEKRYVTVKSVGYTGWKLVGVTPTRSVSFSGVKTRLFILFVVLLILFLLLVINFYISSKITDPIHELEGSVRKLEDGKLDVPVYIGGSYEIQHLGRSIANMASQIQVLMQDIVEEHEAKRKREFDTLQSQINPHFLYNTLDIIVWMVENEKKSEAVKVVTALARFFRISLSKGKSIIPVRDELEHVRNYLTIQQMRFKNKFTYQISAREEVLELASLKLMLQPLVENAIYHGMEFMDGDGEILIQAEICESSGHLCFLIQDNGLGMTGEQVEGLFADQSHVPSKRGSGIGVRNVNERIKLYFGEDYGLRIWSEPDEGTKIFIDLPAVPYQEVLKKDIRSEKGGQDEAGKA
ncbi:MAG: sensor histidine kinase [Lachnospiraceae bacterium]|nr:sensor histidine kinase [Lachnospiraceae bacterium]